MRLLEQVQEQFCFERIVVVPSKYPPGKSAVAPFAKRFFWCQEVFSAPYFLVSDLEARTDTTLFGHDIYVALTLKYPEAQFSWILGEDQWLQLAYWKEIESYAFKLEWLVIRRSTDQRLKPEGLLSRRLSSNTCPYRTTKTEVLAEVSSSRIRESLESNPSSLDTSWIPPKICEDVIRTYQKET